MKPSEVLREARALLEPRGAWIQGHWHADDCSSHCPIGAVHHSENPNASHSHNCGKVGHQQALRIFERANNLGPYEVLLWNDAPSRRKHQVLAAFDRAIALAESEGQ